MTTAIPIIFPPPLHHHRRHRPSPLKSHHHHHSSTTQIDVDLGISPKHVKTLAKFQSPHNYIRVFRVSRAAHPHPLSGATVLLLDSPGNIHSISHPFETLTQSYYDVFATLPPVLPPGPIAVLGFAAGTAAGLLLRLYPDTVLHGYEIDPHVISVGRQFFELKTLERDYSDRLFIHIGDALNADYKSGFFAGMAVDLFSKGCVVPQLQEAETWRRLKKGLKKGGRVMVNVGGGCVEAEDVRKDGRVVMEETLMALREGFDGDEVHILRVDDRDDDSAVAVTGGLPERDAWKMGLIEELRWYVDLWEKLM